MGTYYGEAAYRTMRDSGGTFKLTGDPVHHDDGYMVGGIVPTKIVTATYPYAGVLADVLRDFVRENALATISRENLYLGTWVHEGKVYIDLSQHVASRDAAVELAHIRGELAIWDCYAGNEINTEVE